jgi:hypothetical protein
MAARTSTGVSGGATSTLKEAADGEGDADGPASQALTSSAITMIAS